ncbi:HNH endonuclease [Microbacterium sp. JC 701]|uniref:HNH endonuclease signature motif containing protein n=1 Tax=Microbacterium sp. JC 701 TaxID=2897389 RepID=UPI001E3608C7|nr:HNH endonuclease signature motif containing protein [Microbacterium sp. JC 701]MCD2169706.1 HNH endonuclease [Microbacterium sp. JC 701]
MTSTAPSEDRPRPVFRETDGAPWPSDDELEIEARWAAIRESADVDWWPYDQPTHQSDALSAVPEVEWWADADDDAPCAVNGVVIPLLIGDSPASEWADIAGAPSEGPRETSSETAPQNAVDPFDEFLSADADDGDLDAPLHRLKAVARVRQRATAEEYRLIASILQAAAEDPTPWAGPDPTRDPSWSDARRRTIRAVRRDRADMAERAAVAEIAVRLRLSEQTVRTRAAHARTLDERTPAVWREFSEGRISERHAVEVARLASSLPDEPEPLQRFDEQVCERAVVLTPAKFAVAARVIRERVHAESLEERHRRAAADRGVWMSAELDGMASLSALLPADRARAVMSRLDGVARSLRALPDEDRTLAQLRADALADLVATVPSGAPEPARVEAATSESPPAGASMSTQPAVAPPQVAPPPIDSPTIDAPSFDSPPVAPPHVAAPPVTPPHVAAPPAASPQAASPPASAAPRSTPSATVIVTVPALTLLGASAEPATLEGYGPIDLDTARRLAGNATSWIRLLTDPVTGAPLALDRKTHRVPLALRRWLGVTHPTCVFPGCNRAARECDIDHRTAWAEGGTTDEDNLDPKCRHHHRLRHETLWEPSASPDGDLTWRSPRGETFDADPPPF